jgi:hypothetical protein
MRRAAFFALCALAFPALGQDTGLRFAEHPSAGMAAAFRPEAPGCPTLPSAEGWAWLEALRLDDDAMDAARGDDTRYVRVKAHLVGKDDHTGYYRMQYLLESLCRLNERFAETGLYFYLDLPVEKHQNDSWWDHTFSAGFGMMLSSNVDGALNVYYVGNIERGTIAGYFSPGADGVVMANGSSGPGASTLTHEFGHFFSLPHTFYGWEGGNAPPAGFQERVDGSNCGSAADGFCDTPPDYAYYRWSCPKTGPFTDPDGVSFEVVDSFHMSYGGDGCRERFSPDQSTAMRANLSGPRAGLEGAIVPDFPDAYDSVRLAEPFDGAAGLPPIGQRFTWSRVPGAVAYHVSVGYNGIFSAIAEEEIVTDTTWVAVRLPEDRRLYWRVKPLFAGNTCEPYSDRRSFSTGLYGTPPTTGLAAAGDGYGPVWPNPVRPGTAVRVALPSGVWTATWVDAFGRTAETARQAVEGQAAWTAPGHPGWYRLVLEGPGGVRLHRSVVVGR